MRGAVIREAIRRNSLSGIVNRPIIRNNQLSARRRKRSFVVLPEPGPEIMGDRVEMKNQNIGLSLMLMDAHEIVPYIGVWRVQIASRKWLGRRHRSAKDLRVVIGQEFIL
jgi:hypothetical protein